LKQKYNTYKIKPTEYKSALSKMKSNVTEGKRRLDALWKERGLQERTKVTNKQIEEEALKGSGHKK
jgi:SMC interacting uncharacterized protein involved in chromosome segregation